VFLWVSGLAATQAAAVCRAGKVLTKSGPVDRSAPTATSPVRSAALAPAKIGGSVPPPWPHEVPRGLAHGSAWPYRRRWQSSTWTRAETLGHNGSRGDRRAVPGSQNCLESMARALAGASQESSGTLGPSPQAVVAACCSVHSCRRRYHSSGTFVNHKVCQKSKEKITREWLEQKPKQS
jgi:hypothetical protein